MQPPNPTEHHAEPKPAPTLQKVREVELDGRLVTCLRGGLIAAGTAGLALLLWINAWWWTGNATEYWLTAPPRLLIIVSCIFGGCARVRWLAREKVRKHWESAKDDEGGGKGKGKVEKRPKLIICCSGGGIKSASFCLGALQALNLRKGQPHSVYETADTVVGVSGGGYMAAAYASRQYDSYNSKRPFQPASDEVDRLRRNTNYLASSGRVRFDLIASLVLGQLVGLTILFAGMCLLAWLIVEECTSVKLIGLDQSPWTFNPQDQSLVALLWMPAVPFFVAVGFFFYTRFVTWNRASRSHVKYDKFLGVLGVRSNTIGNETSKTPNLMILIAALFVIIYPGVPYVAVHLDQLFPEQLQTWVGWKQAMVAAGAVITFFVSVRSATKRTTKPTKSNLDHLLVFLRQKVAPWLGVSIAFLGAYFIVVKITATVLSSYAHQTPPTALLWISGAGLLLARIFLSANNTSMFRFYRSRLRHAFLHPDDRVNDDAAESRSGDPAAPNRPFTLAEVASMPEGQRPQPRLVLCATANIKDGDVLPSGRNGTTFILSNEIGFTDDRLPGGDYRQSASTYAPSGMLSEMDLASAAAISGAAVAPLDGRGNKALGAYRVLLALANIRLGCWVRNPYWTGDDIDFDTSTANGKENPRSTFHDLENSSHELAQLATEISVAANYLLNDGALPPISKDDVSDLQRRIRSELRSQNVADDQLQQLVHHPRRRKQLLHQRAELNALGAQLASLRRQVTENGGSSVPGSTPSKSEIKVRRRLAQKAGTTAQQAHFLAERSRRGAVRASRPWSLRFAKLLDLDSPYQVVHEAFGSPSINSPYLYLTDGGHYDNLGLVEALRRYPEQIIMLDGSGDPEDEFPAMGDAIASARMDLGVEIDFNPAPLTRAEAKYPASGWMQATATYWNGVKDEEAPAKAECAADRPAHPVYIKGSICVIDYVKCVLPEGLSWDLESYRKRDPEFPTTSTKYELYDEFDFEAYRRLGWSLIMNAEEHGWVLPTPSTKPTTAPDENVDVHG